MNPRGVPAGQPHRPAVHRDRPKLGKKLGLLHHCAAVNWQRASACRQRPGSARARPHVRPRPLAPRCAPARPVHGHRVDWQCPAPRARSAPHWRATPAAAAPTSSPGFHRKAIASRVGSPWLNGAKGVPKLSSDDLFQAITQATHGGDAHRSVLDFLAQAVDIDLDGVVADLFAPLAQTLHQLVFADQPA